MLLSHECSTYGVHIKPLTISHSQAEMSCLATETIYEEEEILFLYDKLIYQMMPDVLNAWDFFG